jgi:phosphate-selective porin OprO/OprP
VHLKFNPVRAMIGLALIALLIPASAVSGEMTANWNNGLKFSDEAGNSIKVGGRVYVDWAWYSADDQFKSTAVVVPQDGAELRQARLFAEGKIHEVVSFKLQVEFASSLLKFKDAYIALLNSPLLGFDLLVGQFKQPLGMEYMQSSKYMTFMERAQLSNYIVNRQNGVMLSRRFFDQRMAFAGSVFRNSNGIGKSVGDNAIGYAGRLTGVPWKNDEGSLLHLGVGAATRDADNGRKLFSEDFYSTQPESHLQPPFKLVIFDASELERSTFVDFEGAAVAGPFTVQGEYMLMSVSAPSGAEDLNFATWYAQASWFLTGETRPYKTTTGVFGRVKPKTNYDGKGGTGAFEIAARYSATDLNDSAFEGGKLDAITLGANWYLNPSTRLMFNWVRSDGESPDPEPIYEDPDNPDPDEIIGYTQSATGVVNTFQTRFQIDF